jgi:hypothetical protein
MKYALLFMLLLPACSGSDENPEPSNDDEPTFGEEEFVRDPVLDVENISRHGAATSHFTGQNCMTCHQPHGPGKGLFSIGGTLRNPDGTPHPDGTVYVTRTDPTALPEGVEIDALEIEPVLTVEVDSFGNFYSTEPLPLPEEPLFVIVERSDGAGRNFMGWPTLTAACNACHVGSNVLAVRH